MIFCKKWPFSRGVFEAVRRDEVADFIASSCSLARDLQNAAIKSTTLSRRTASKTQITDFLEIEGVSARKLKNRDFTGRF